MQLWKAISKCTLYYRLNVLFLCRDFELIKWTGANSFRTSHYPYADEIMDFADENGIVIIDECAGVNLHTFDKPLMQHHFQVLDVVEVAHVGHAGDVAGHGGVGEQGQEPTERHSLVDRQRARV